MGFKLNYKKIFLIFLSLFLVSVLFIYLVISLSNLIGYTLSILLVVIGFLVMRLSIPIRNNKFTGFCILFLVIISVGIIALIVLFSTCGLDKNISNPISKNISFDVYVVNGVLSNEKALSYVNEGNLFWNTYNISIGSREINQINLTITKEEINFLYETSFPTKEECLRYTQLINNSKYLSIIFLDNNKSKNFGRGCLCNCTFILISPEKIFFWDFTGWDIAHEIGHVLGLIDTPFSNRTKQNLMNDEFKQRLGIISDYLSKSQLGVVLNNSKLS